MMNLKNTKAVEFLWNRIYESLGLKIGEINKIGEYPQFVNGREEFLRNVRHKWGTLVNKDKIFSDGSVLSYETAIYISVLFERFNLIFITRAFNEESECFGYTLINLMNKYRQNKHEEAKDYYDFINEFPDGCFPDGSFYDIDIENSFKDLAFAILFENCKYQ